eukprot:c19369_g1_i3 orf=133-333(+)
MVLAISGNRTRCLVSCAHPRAWTSRPAVPGRDLNEGVTAATTQTDMPRAPTHRQASKHLLSTEQKY